MILTLLIRIDCFYLEARRGGANRLHCRFRHADTKKIELCYTLNGSALALPRIVATIIENNQTPEGIRVPKVLVPYCGFEMLDDKMD